MWPLVSVGGFLTWPKARDNRKEKIFEAEMKITDHIHALKIPFQIADPSGLKIPRFVYVFLICGQKICVIDSGVANAERIIFDYLRSIGRSPQDISLLVLTHSHPDHIGAAMALKKATCCVVAAHEAEKAWIQDIDLQVKERPVPGFHSLAGGPVNVDCVLEDGDRLDLGDGLGLQVIYTPGHSKGSISLWLPEEGALFSGDAIPLAGDMPIYEDALETAKSIRKLRSIAGIEVLLAAWDDPQEGSIAYQIIDESLHYLQSIHEAVLKIYAKEPSLDSMSLCQLVLKDLGLPNVMANPLIARSFQANLKSR
jgi:hydroxyacylglutathione hydrolase